ncbi:MAG: IclR family transcriptional regulator [Clostridiales Family XIII bacterium]|jgi:IclR family pca regulon transcriptional regulator|nr:IclR family transcriptional regulator [Clostridiales Family XIII bacterium]
MARIGGRQRAFVEFGGEENSELYVRALARGLSILTLFDVEHPVWSLRDITRHTGLSKTTAYRMLRTLEWKGFVALNPETELYSIGSAAIPVAYLTLSYIGFSRLAQPILEKLAAATGETAELAVEGKGGVVVVGHVTTSNPFKPNLPIGRVLRNLSNSGVKVLAAYWPKEDRERMLRESHAALTPHTITDPALLRAELAKAAETGVAFDREEQDLGVCAVSAPVFGADHKMKAVVTVVAPAERFGPENSKRNAEAVKAAAAELAGCLSQPLSPLGTL